VIRFRYRLAGAWRTLRDIRQQYLRNAWKAQRDAEWARELARRNEIDEAHRTIALKSDPVIASIVASQNTVLKDGQTQPNRLRLR
jgi:hypothetical protein